MSSLAEEIQRRQATRSLSGAKPPEKKQVSELRVKDSKGLNWGFPWNHYSFVCHDETGDSEKIILGFASHEILVLGHKLEGVREEMTGSKLEVLRRTPGKYVHGLNTEPTVTDIFVKTRGEKEALDVGSESEEPQP